MTDGTLQGRAAWHKEPHQLERGEWTWWDDGYFARCPDGGVANLKSHKCIIEADGSLTVSPSILITGGSEHSRTQWHGFLEKGVWRNA